MSTFAYDFSAKSLLAEFEQACVSSALANSALLTFHNYLNVKAYDFPRLLAIRHKKSSSYVCIRLRFYMAPLARIRQKIIHFYLLT